MDALPKILDGALKNPLWRWRMLIEKNLPKIRSGIELIVSLITGIVGSIAESLIPAAIDAIMQIVEALIDNVDMLIDASIEIVLALTMGIIDATEAIENKIPEIVTKLVERNVNNAPKLLLEAGLQIMLALGGAL